MEFIATVVGGKDASVESLEWLLRGSQFAVVTAVRSPAPPDAAPGDRPGRPGPAHQARKLLNRVALLTHCLLLPDLTDAEWRQWPSDIADANRELEALYAGGLSRDFLGEPTRSHRPPQTGVA